MSSVNPLKPIISSVITLVWLGCFVFIDTSSNGYLHQFWNYDEAGANAFKWWVIAVVGIIWLGVQIFLDAPPESSRLSLAISGTIMWLGLILFYHFADPAFGGAVAFFALIGGLAVVIIWTRYLADDFS
jgi:hypothetical protein